MWILILCIVFNAILGVIFKLFEKYKIDNLQAIVVNYITCIAVASIVQGGLPFPDRMSEEPWFIYAFGLGFAFIIVFNTLALTMQHFGMVIGSIFQKMSLIAPTLLAILVYHEPSNIYKWIGIAAAIISIFLLSYEKPDDGANNPKKNAILWLFPIITFLGSCLIDSGFYFIERNHLGQNSDISFVASLFLFTAIYGVLILIIQLLGKKTRLAWKNVVAGVILGIPNFFSIYLLLLALQQGLGGAVVFPINNVGILILSAFLGIILFREHITKYKIVGFLLAIFSIVLITT